MKKDQIETVKALGLKKINMVEHEDTPQIRGMIDKISYMLKLRKYSKEV